MTIKLKLLGAVALVGAFAATPASAEFANTLGIGQKSSNLGQAGVATASDYDVFYVNPAGAANIVTPTIGVGLKVLNTTGLHADEPGFNHDVEATVRGSENGYLPSVGAYVPGLLPNVVLGVGFGAVQGFAGDWNNEQPTTFNPTAGLGGTLGANGADANGLSSYGGTGVELVLAELTPTVGIKLSDKLNIGASVGFTTLKHFRVGIDAFIGATVADVADDGVVNNSLGGAAARGHLVAQTSDDIGLPIPPWGFATSPHEASFTIGAQYQLLPNVAIGGVFRSESPTEYDLDLVLDAGPFGTQRGKGTLKLEAPRHVQIGATVDVTPTLRVSADVKWTNWANATGIGSPFIVQIASQTFAPGIPAGGLLGGAISQLVAQPMRGDDTYSIHVGVQYKLMPNLELQAGYNYDPAVFDEGNVSYLLYSSDRHIYSLGATIELPDSALLGSTGTWEWTIGGQFVHYEDRTIDVGQSATFGLGTPGVAPGATPFSSNSNSWEIGGYAWTAGLSGVYKFGAPEEVAFK